MANPIGAVFGMIFIAVFLFFGMGATATIMDGTNCSINESSPMYDDYQTSKTVTEQGYAMASYTPYIYGLIIVISVLLVLVGVIVVAAKRR